MSKEKEEESPDYVISGEPWNSDGMTVCWNLSCWTKWSISFFEQKGASCMERDSSSISSSRMTSA